jgi:4-aminobutyrate aminotransferase-like enzyme
MNEVAREILGRKRPKGSTFLEVRTLVLAPERDPRHGDFSCRVHCPAVLAADKRIAGADAAQAQEPAAMIVECVLRERGFEVVAA